MICGYSCLVYFNRIFPGIQNDEKNKLNENNLNGPLTRCDRIDYTVWPFLIFFRNSSKMRIDVIFC